MSVALRVSSRSSTSAASSVTQVTFFADGRQTCSIPRAPFECDWDAGEGISEHQIRAVATLKNAQRLVATVRTRGVAYAESVDVDVVQVTAVVTDGDRFIRGLTDKDFRVFDDDAAAHHELRGRKHSAGARRGDRC